MFINSAPMTWYSIGNNTVVETSTFDLEFVALRVGLEINDSLR